MQECKLVRVDRRGNRWFQTQLNDNQTHSWLQEVCQNWETVSDEDVAMAKKKLVDKFNGDVDGAMGQPCQDFLYVFGKDGKSHYFVCTDPAVEDTCLMYEGECDMTFAACATFDLVKMQRDDGMI